MEVAEATLEISQCCASQQWVKEVVNLRPFKDFADLNETSKAIWNTLEEADYLEAFKAHPKIGDVDSLSKKFSNTKHLASNEQSLVNKATEQTIQELAKENTRYFDKFGFIFIIFATGKTAEDMLKILKARITNSRSEEIENAAVEQFKITELRLNQLFLND